MLNTDDAQYFSLVNVIVVVAVAVVVIVIVVGSLTLTRISGVWS